MTSEAWLARSAIAARRRGLPGGGSARAMPASAGMMKRLARRPQPEPRGPWLPGTWISSDSSVSAVRPGGLRPLASRCEMCDTTGQAEVHHIRAPKDLTPEGKRPQRAWAKRTGRCPAAGLPGIEISGYDLSLRGSGGINARCSVLSIHDPTGSLRSRLRQEPGSGRMNNGDRSRLSSGDDGSSPGI